MNWSSYLLSLCLHAAFILLVLFWPTSPPIKLDSPPVMISLVDGAPGGNRTPSNILGKMGKPTNGPKDISPPAKKDEVARRARPEKAEAVPVAEEKTPQPKIPKPQPQPKEEAVPLAKKKEPEKPREKPKEETEQPKEKPKEQPREQPKEKAKEQKKAQDKPKAKPKSDPIKDALAQAKRSASSRVESGDRGNAVEQALAQARRNAGGTGGGGGGEGDGPGGGGLNEAYLGTVMLSVRPNWSYASASRANMSCVVHVTVNMQGEVQQATVTQSSGNVQYDASAVNSIWRTSRGGEFPPPPSAEFTELDLVFTLNEMMGR